jgi:hypothetical protein
VIHKSIAPWGATLYLYLSSDNATELQQYVYSLYNCGGAVEIPDDFIAGQSLNVTLHSCARMLRRGLMTMHAVRSQRTLALIDAHAHARRKRNRNRKREATQHMGAVLAALMAEFQRAAPAPLMRSPFPEIILDASLSATYIST